MSTSSDLIEARALAEAVLQAAGTSLRNYDLNGTQARILAAAEAERLAAEQRGVDRQREADAKIADGYAQQFPAYPEFDQLHNAGVDIAAAIRNTKG